MKRLFATVLAAGLLAAGCGDDEASTSTPSSDPGSSAPQGERAPADPDAPVAAWTAGVNAAGWDFHRTLDGNAVSSPLSIGTAFGLASAGASPETAAVLDEIFGFPAAGAHEAANAVDLRLEQASTGPTTVEVANRLFPDDEFTPLDAFIETAASRYGATADAIDLDDGDAGAEVINGWVSDRTRGLIPEIVNATAVEGKELFLVNTVYLKAEWEVPFLTGMTSDGPFTTDEGVEVTVPFMHDREPLERRFVRFDGADAVELPYAGDELAMWLLIPHEDDGLADLEAGLDADELAALGIGAETGLVDLSMPKWEQTLPPTDLFSWLCPRGLCPGPDAAFDGIAPGIFLSGARHGAKVIVDELGTEAAAATALDFDDSGPPPADLTVTADHPFLWTIVHEDTGAVLFVGRLADPSA